jgi:hypothetical protein
MADPATMLVAALTTLASGYCVVRCVAPRCGRSHPRSVDALHIGMGAAMVAMLLARLAPVFGLLGLVAFGVAATWFLAEAWIRRRAASHLRAGLGAAAMAGMLAPVAFAAPSVADPAVANPAVAPIPMRGSGMSMGASAYALSGWLVVVVLGLAASVAVAAVVVGVRARARSGRLGAACEVAMAAAMAYMVLTA